MIAITPGLIRAVSIAVYKLRLEASSGGGPGAVERMLAKDGDDGEKLAGRSESYDALTRAYITAISSLGIFDDSD